MATRVYGTSDDLIESEGDVDGEICFCGDDEEGALLFCSDGSLLEIKYGKADAGIWAINTINKGTLLDRVDVCSDENAQLYSDVAYFRDGLKWIYVATKWERMK